MATLQLKRSISIDEKLRDHSNDTFVVKKLESAKRLIRQVGLPKTSKK